MGEWILPSVRLDDARDKREDLDYILIATTLYALVECLSWTRRREADEKISSFLADMLQYIALSAMPISCIAIAGVYSTGLIYLPGGEELIIQLLLGSTVSLIATSTYFTWFGGSTQPGASAFHSRESVIVGLVVSIIFGATYVGFAWNIGPDVLFGLSTSLIFAVPVTTALGALGVEWLNRKMSLKTDETTPFTMRIAPTAFTVAVCSFGAAIVLR